MFCTARHLTRQSTAVRRAITVRSPIGGRNNNAIGSRNSLTRISLPSLRSMVSNAKSAPKQQPNANISNAAAAKTRAGSGKVASGTPYIKDRGPVSWASLFLIGVAAASVVAYYNIERERRLESAMGRVVSSESDGWSPNPGVMAPRKFKLTPWGYFPEDDGFGPCKLERTCLVSTL
jgi:hypothetical protein